CAGPVRKTPPLRVVRRALKHALKAGGRLGLAAVVDCHVYQVVIEIAGERLLERVKIDFAGLHHSGSVYVIGQGEEEVLQRLVLVLSLNGMGECAVHRRGGGKLGRVDVVEWSSRLFSVSDTLSCYL